jgi:DnaK suppressor protein
MSIGDRLRQHALRARLQGDVGQTANAALSKDESERPSVPTDMAELGPYDGDREIALNLLDSEKGVLEQIEAALARIEDGSYGRCEKCGLARIAHRDGSKKPPAGYKCL